MVEISIDHDEGVPEGDAGGVPEASASREITVWAGIAAAVFWVLFLAAELTARLGSLYRTHPSIDLLNHALAGAALGATWILLGQRWWSRSGRADPNGPPGRSRPASLRQPSFLRLGAIGVLGTLAVSMAWELGEMIEERIRVNPPHLLDPFLWDGVSDVTAAGVAALAMVTFLLRRRSTPRRTPDIHRGIGPG